MVKMKRTDRPQDSSCNKRSYNQMFRNTLFNTVYERHTFNTGRGLNRVLQTEARSRCDGQRYTASPSLAGHFHTTAGPQSQEQHTCLAPTTSATSPPNARATRWSPWFPVISPMDVTASQLQSPDHTDRG